MSGSINTIQPSLGLTQLILRNGVFPSRGDGTGLDGFPTGDLLGSILTFAGNFAVGGSSLLQGQSFGIGQNTALFAVLGTSFGGNGVSNFAIPNADGRLLVSSGQGFGLPDHPHGTAYGANSVALLQANLPASSGGTSVAVSDVQATLPIRYGIAAQGVFPNGNNLSLESIGVVHAFAGNYVPGGLVEADGRLLAIDDYLGLFQLIGTTYGGDGQTTFGVPDLRGRVIVGTSTALPIGTLFGAETDAITQANMPVSMGGGGSPITSYQPSIALNRLVATQGSFPSPSGGVDSSNPLIGQVITTLFDFVPSGWARADGTVLSISQNQALFSLIGTTFGGDGRTTFAVPDLRGRAVVGTGTTVALGDRPGTEFYSITSAMIPALTIPGTAGNDSFWGGDSADSISGAAGNDALVGNAGNDTLDGGAGNDTMDGSAGIDTASFASAASAVFYGLLAQGSAFNTQGAGTDTLNNFENLTGSAFADTLGGDTGANILDGGQGDDALYGWVGQDTLLGGAGNDVLDGGTGNDSLVGGAGNDTYVVDSAGDVVVENAAEGTDIVFVTVNGWTASANLEAIYLSGSATSVTGSAGDDTLVAHATLGSTLNGGGGNDTLWGGAGNDTLVSGTGNDVLRGGGGNDVLSGGAGNDQLLGGAGADDFLFDTAAWGYDQIFDFVRGTDHLDLRGSGAANLAALTLFTPGGNTAVIYGGARIDLYGVATLDASDFIF